MEPLKINFDPQYYDENWDLMGQNQNKGGGMFENWNNDSTANLLKGIGTVGSLHIGLENLDMARKNWKLKKQQHAAWMQDRAEDKARRDRVSSIRF